MGLPVRAAGWKSSRDIFAEYSKFSHNLIPLNVNLCWILEVICLFGWHKRCQVRFRSLHLTSCSIGISFLPSSFLNACWFSLCLTVVRPNLFLLCCPWTEFRFNLTLYGHGAFIRRCCFIRRCFSAGYTYWCFHELNMLKRNAPWCEAAEWRLSGSIWSLAFVPVTSTGDSHPMYIYTSSTRIQN